jgi:hypothetical protein
VQELTDFGFGAYQMSISWSRVITFETNQTGARPVGKINKEGVAHYHKVLAALKAANVEVALTMWHWDTPEALENYAYHNPSCKVHNLLPIQWCKEQALSCEGLISYNVVFVTRPKLQMGRSQKLGATGSALTRTSSSASEHNAV